MLCNGWSVAIMFVPTSYDFGKLVKISDNEVELQSENGVIFELAGDIISFRRNKSHEVSQSDSDAPLAAT